MLSSHDLMIRWMCLTLLKSAVTKFQLENRHNFFSSDIFGGNLLGVFCFVALKPEHRCGRLYRLLFLNFRTNLQTDVTFPGRVKL